MRWTLPSVEMTRVWSGMPAPATRIVRLMPAPSRLTAPAVPAAAYSECFRNSRRVRRYRPPTTGPPVSPTLLTVGSGHKAAGDRQVTSRLAIGNGLNDPETVQILENQNALQRQ